MLQQHGSPPSFIFSDIASYPENFHGGNSLGGANYLRFNLNKPWPQGIDRDQ